MICIRACVLCVFLLPIFLNVLIVFFVAETPCHEPATQTRPNLPSTHAYMHATFYKQISI